MTRCAARGNNDDSDKRPDDEHGSEDRRASTAGCMTAHRDADYGKAVGRLLCAAARRQLSWPP